MADYFPDFFSEFKAAVMTIWGLDDDHVFTSLQALRQNVVNELALNEGSAEVGLNSPYGVIDIGRLVPDNDFGIQNDVKRAPLTAWFVDRLRNRDNQQFVHAKAYDLGYFVDHGDFEHFQSIDDNAEIDSSSSNAGNSEFLDSQVRLICASVSWSRGLLVGTRP